MDPKDVPTNTEAELESFRQKWREEVTARSTGKAPASAKNTATSSSSKPHANKSNAPDAQSHADARRLSLEGGDEVGSYTYHGLGEKQHGRRLDETSAQTAAALAPHPEPQSALEHYEQAVEKESQGNLGDSVDLYRKAFKVSSLFSDVELPRPDVHSLIPKCKRYTKQSTSHPLTLRSSRLHNLQTYQPHRRQPHPQRPYPKIPILQTPLPQYPILPTTP